MPTISIPEAATTPVLGGYLAVPTGTGPWPGVVVLHEIFGLTEDTRRQADRLAAAGFLAVAPDLFSNGGALRCLRSTFAALSSGQGATFGDIEATRAWLAGREDCTGRIGVIGFCLGGGFALLGATRGFDASAPNYGPLPKDDELLRGACPIVASYGRRDLGLRGAAARLETTLTGLQVEHDVKEYPDAGHSFLSHHPVGPLVFLERIVGLAYHEPSAQDAWARILRTFDAHLRGAGSVRPYAAE